MSRGCSLRRAENFAVVRGRSLSRSLVARAPTELRRAFESAEPNRSPSFLPLFPRRANRIGLCSFRSPLHLLRRPLLRFPLAIFRFASRASRSSRVTPIGISFHARHVSSLARAERHDGASHREIAAIFEMDRRDVSFPPRNATDTPRASVGRSMSRDLARLPRVAGCFFTYFDERGRAIGEKTCTTTCGEMRDTRRTRVRRSEARSRQTQFVSTRERQR